MTPAPLKRRALAGAVDFAAVVFISLVYFVAPILLRGLVLPMWGVLLAMVGYCVVPLAFLKKTVGMRLFGLELARRDGHAVDLANVLFRELVGRGYFPAAFLFTVLAGLVGRALGVAAFAMPMGLAGLMFLVSCFALVAAVLGHLLVFQREDQRSLADLFAGSFVVVGPARAPPDDAEERDAARAEHRARVRNIAVFEVLLVALAFGVPWALSSRGGETTAQHGARIKRQALKRKFDADPGNVALAAELSRALWAAGLDEEAGEVAKRHQAALDKRDVAREATLRQRLDTTPSDEATASALIELYESQGRLEDAKGVYLRWLGERPTPGRRGGYANWLASVGFDEAAEAELRAALREEPLLPMGHTMLGLVLQRLGRLKEAQEELFVAVLDDAEDEDAAGGLAEVTAELGPLPMERQEALSRQHRAWSGDGGAGP